MVGHCIVTIICTIIVGHFIRSCQKVGYTLDATKYCPGSVILQEFSKRV